MPKKVSKDTKKKSEVAKMLKGIEERCRFFMDQGLVPNSTPILVILTALIDFSANFHESAGCDDDLKTFLVNCNWKEAYEKGLDSTIDIDYDYDNSPEIFTSFVASMMGWDEHFFQQQMKS